MSIYDKGFRDLPDTNPPKPLGTNIVPKTLPPPKPRSVVPTPYKTNPLRKK